MEEKMCFAGVSKGELKGTEYKIVTDLIVLVLGSFVLTFKLVEQIVTGRLMLSPLNTKLLGACKLQDKFQSNLILTDHLKSTVIFLRTQYHACTQWINSHYLSVKRNFAIALVLHCYAF